MALLDFEDANVRAYTLMLRIEVALRELLRKAMEAEHGPAWRKHIPGDQLQVIRAAEKDEQRRPQFDFLRLGPLYYLTLGDLLPLLEQKGGRAAVDCLGGERFVEQFRNLPGLRNALAHGRSVSRSGLTFVESLYCQFEAALTPAALAGLLSDPDIGMRPDDAAPRIAAWFQAAAEAMAHLTWPCAIEPDYEVAERQYWWGNSGLVNWDYAAITHGARLVEGYNSLPDGLGSAGPRLNFVVAERAPEHLSACAKALMEAEIG